MKNIFLRYLVVLLIILTSTSCGKKPKVEEEYYPDGSLKSAITMVDGKRNGITKLFYQGGYLKAEINYKDDMKEGWDINYVKGAQRIYSKIPYHLDKREGKALIYYDSGKLYRETPYSNDKTEGLEKKYYENGKIMAEIPYSHGFPGVGLKEYDTDGLLIPSPKIIVTRLNKMESMKTLILNISLSDKSENAQFYQDTLVNGKYTFKYMREISSTKGIATIAYYIQLGTFQKRNVSIIAQKTTSLDNPCILHLNYVLDITF